ncbi:Oligopeptide/dipeptide transporter domain family protein [mine drainage metagenome]|uniref:Oligopeptide/dipeptide transporter domain family protein n=1 Tax=mine drainage metagenome TaxID=410659 RepID=T1AZ40_9ZZZZ
MKGLRTFFFTYDGTVRAIDGVSFRMKGGETLGLVGETGCGKSVTAFSITRLISDPPGRIVEGEVWFRGANLLWGLDREARFVENPRTHRVKVKRRFRRVRAASERMAAIRGTGIGMIFQEPTQAMNPIFSISDQVGETLLLHRGQEIIDEMLAFRSQILDQPAVAQAIDQVVEVVANRQLGPELRAACDGLARTVGVRSVATEVYYIALSLAGELETLRADVVRALRRLCLTGFQRRYLKHRRRGLLIQKALNEGYLREMREGRPYARQRRVLQARQGSERFTHFYFGIWGLRGRSQRALKHEVFWRSVATLETVSIPNPVQVARGYPHELSGGMIQRVMIAMTLAPEPDVLIADEPTTALDVTIQAQILELMRGLKERVGTAILLITHDLAVIAEVADRVNVMYAGRIVESASVRDLFRQPLHPYTQGLLASIPRLDRPEKELASIPGSVPNLLSPPPGCRFHPRCPYAMPICKGETPPMTVEGPGHQVACYLYAGPLATN